MNETIRKMLRPEQIAAYLEAANVSVMPLLDLIFPASTRRMHQSITVGLDSMIRDTNNVPHTNRGGEYWPLASRARKLVHFVVPPIRIGSDISEVDLNDIEEYYNAGNMRGIQDYLAERAIDRAQTYRKTSQAMVADFIRSEGTMTFPIWTDANSDPILEAVDYPLHERWLTDTATLLWDDSSATIMTVYNDLITWSRRMRDENNQNGTKLIMCPGDVYGRLLALAHGSQTTASIQITIGEQSIKLGSFELRSVDGSYNSYVHGSGAATDLLEEKKIFMVSDDFRREFLYCKTEMRDNNGNTIAYRTDMDAPMVMKMYWSEDSECMKIKSEAKPLPVSNPASWLTATVLA